MKHWIKTIGIVAIASLGFFWLGWHLHQPPIDMTPDGPYFTEATPFLHIAYGDTCPPIDISDDYVCIYKLSHDTLNKADALAQKLLQAVPASSTEQYAGFYEFLRTNVKAAQKARDGYFDGICDLDQTFIYGGSGMGLEREACRYYYADQYLKVLQKLESKL